MGRGGGGLEGRLDVEHVPGAQVHQGCLGCLRARRLPRPAAMADRLAGSSPAGLACLPSCLPGCLPDCLPGCLPGCLLSCLLGHLLVWPAGSLAAARLQRAHHRGEVGWEVEIVVVEVGLDGGPEAARGALPMSLPDGPCGTDGRPTQLGAPLTGQGGGGPASTWRLRRPCFHSLYSY